MCNEIKCAVQEKGLLEFISQVPWTIIFTFTFKHLADAFIQSN